MYLLAFKSMHYYMNNRSFTRREGHDRLICLASSELAVLPNFMTIKAFRSSLWCTYKNTGIRITLTAESLHSYPRIKQKKNYHLLVIDYISLIFNLQKEFYSSLTFKPHTLPIISNTQILINPNVQLNGPRMKNRR